MNLEGPAAFYYDISNRQTIKTHSLLLAEKYCTLVRNENGEPLLTQILYSDKLTESIKNLAQTALTNVQR
jgi:hypothetical protein